MNEIVFLGDLLPAFFEVSNIVSVFVNSVFDEHELILNNTSDQCKSIQYTHLMIRAMVMYDFLTTFFLLCKDKG